jgi:hypothetical protein
MTFKKSPIDKNWRHDAHAHHKIMKAHGKDILVQMKQPDFNKYTAQIHPMPGSTSVDRYFNSEEEKDKFLEETFPDLYKIHKSRVGKRPPKPL